LISKILIAVGAVLVLTGMGAVAAGAPDWVLGLSLGATLIQSGVIALVGGIILIALALVLNTLEELLERLNARAPTGVPALPHRAEPEHRPALPAAPAAREPPPIPGMEEAIRARRERAREAPPEDSVRRPAPPPGPRPTRLLDQATEEVTRLRQEHAKQEQVQQGQRDEGQRPRRPAPVVSLPPSHADERRRPRESTPDEPIYKPKFRSAESAAPAVPAQRNPDAEKVVRSGVIGGMAYTLYADGSIEAELPIGTVRFDSINDLQQHVLRTGAEADADFDEQTR
jgi:hypothetical protein